MGNTGGASTVSAPALGNQSDNQKSPVDSSIQKIIPVSSAVLSSSATTTQAPKCPISGQESKDGQTCAYDPTKMSFWQTKAIAQMIQKPFEASTATPEVGATENGGCPVKSSNFIRSNEEGCPIKVKSNTMEKKEENPVSAFVKVYKNPTQYNVSHFCLKSSFVPIKFSQILFSIAL